MIDFDAYLERIGLAGVESPDWRAIHRAQVISIPFENLDSHRGIPVSLEPADLERKLVAQRRGGYCFEQNLLLASALEHLGLAAEPLLGRVRRPGSTAESRPATHLILRVTDEHGEQWHADAGFGLGTLLDPIPFGAAPERVYEQSGWRYRVIEDVAELVLQQDGREGWSDMYGFTADRARRIDIEVNNWWTCTSPNSAFRFGLIASIDHDDGRREAISDWSGPVQAMAISPAGITSQEQPRTVIPGTLERFGLPGFELDGDGRVRASD